MLVSIRRGTLMGVRHIRFESGTGICISFTLDVFPALAVKELILWQSLHRVGVIGRRCAPSILEAISRDAHVGNSLVAPYDKIKTLSLGFPNRLIQHLELCL